MGARRDHRPHGEQVVLPASVLPTGRVFDDVDGKRVVSLLEDPLLHFKFDELGQIRVRGKTGTMWAPTKGNKSGWLVTIVGYTDQFEFAADDVRPAGRHAALDTRIQGV